MIQFRKDFNCCKTVGCKNFGVLDSPDYVYKSWRLGYLSIECKACGSYPPWINNELISDVLKEKMALQFARKLTGCPKCYPYFFLTEQTEAKLHGFTSAGSQRKKCSQCHAIFTMQNYKNIEPLHAVLSTILANKEIRLSIKNSGLSARLYYFYLNKLALIFSNFSRLQEEKALKRGYLALHTEGRLVALEHHRGLYTLITSELSSGYILLQNNNLTAHPLPEKEIYSAQENTIISVENFTNLENILSERYLLNHNRKHFEQLLVGKLKPISKCHLIYPDKLTYVHFQLLQAFILKTEKYDHYIEHESCLRAAALMGSYPDIKSAKAGVYYFYPYSAGPPLQGKEIGWWKDRWFSNEFGAYSPITPEREDKFAFKLAQWDSISLFDEYIDKHLNKGVNSKSVIDNLSEIHRVIFNYCELKEGQTRANVFGVSREIYSAQSLLDEAVKVVMAE